MKQVLPVIEKELAPFNARPHWGKLFTISPRDAQVYLWKDAGVHRTGEEVRSAGKVSE